MTSKFYFYPVGNGLFYSGFIDDFCFIYDCGIKKRSDKEVELAVVEYHNTYCEYYCKKLPKELKNSIDLVILSHLHEDHINCINTLERDMEIKKIIIPYLSFDEIIVLGKELSFEDLRTFLKLYLRFIKKKNVVMFFGNEDESHDYNTKLSGFWEFHIYRQQSQAVIQEKERDKTVKALCNKLKSAATSTIEKLMELSGKIDTSKRNATSLILVHGPCSSNAQLASTDDKTEIWTKNHQLLTGDAENIDQLLAQINPKTLVKVNVFQIPHHGSLDNIPKSWSKENKVNNNLQNCDHWIVSATKYPPKGKWRTIIQKKKLHCTGSINKESRAITIFISPLSKMDFFDSQTTLILSCNTNHKKNKRIFHENTGDSLKY